MHCSTMVVCMYDVCMMYVWWLRDTVKNVNTKTTSEPSWHNLPILLSSQTYLTMGKFNRFTPTATRVQFHEMFIIRCSSDQMTNTWGSQPKFVLNNDPKLHIATTRDIYTYISSFISTTSFNHPDIIRCRIEPINGRIHRYYTLTILKIQNVLLNLAPMNDEGQGTGPDHPHPGYPIKDDN